MLKVKNVVLLVVGCAVIATMWLCLELLRPNAALAAGGRQRDLRTLLKRVAALEEQQIEDGDKFLLIDQTLKSVKTKISNIRITEKRMRKDMATLQVDLGELRQVVRAYHRLPGPTQ